MMVYYLMQLIILGAAYSIFFILAYTPIGRTITGIPMPIWLLYTKLIVLTLLGLYLILRSMFKMRAKGKELCKSPWAYNIITVCIGYMILINTSYFAYIIGLGY